MTTRAMRMRDVRSDIRGPLFEEALRMQAEGQDVLKLNTGNPGTFGFGLPDSLRQALLSGMDRAVPYSDLRGMADARQAILTYHQHKGIQGLAMNDIYLGNGVSELAHMALTALLNPGDEMLLPAPCYTLWSNTVRLMDAKAVFYRCDESVGWYPDADDIRRKITPRTRALLIINPNNPTGALYPAPVLEELLSIAREHGLLVFSDEIYDRLLFDGATHTSTASLAPDLPVITMNGLSKSHNVCGFRCGWMVVSGPRKQTKEILTGLTQLAAMRLCANTLMQLVVPAALQDNESTQAMVRPGGRLYEQRSATLEVLGRTQGVSFVPNAAAFYLFPKLDTQLFGITDDRAFAMDLLHATNVLVIPGSGFELDTPDHLRIVMLPEAAQLRRAMERIKEYLDGRRA